MQAPGVSEQPGDHLAHLTHGTKQGGSRSITAWAALESQVLRPALCLLSSPAASSPLHTQLHCHQVKFYLPVRRHRTTDTHVISAPSADNAKAPTH